MLAANDRKANCVLRSKFSHPGPPTESKVSSSALLMHVLVEFRLCLPLHTETTLRLSSHMFGLCRWIVFWGLFALWLCCEFVFRCVFGLPGLLGCANNDAVCRFWGSKRPLPSHKHTGKGGLRPPPFPVGFWVREKAVSEKSTKSCPGAE